MTELAYMVNSRKNKIYNNKPYGEMVLKGNISRKSITNQSCIKLHPVNQLLSIRPLADFGYHFRAFTFIAPKHFVFQSFDFKRS